MEIEKLKEEQRRLARKLILTDDFLDSDIKTVAGCTLLFSQDEMIAVVVVLDSKTLELVDRHYLVTRPKIPYYPLFQSYREIPAIAEAVMLLKTKPDMIIYDGNGILHPLRLGCAAHLGLVLDIPSIGVSKKIPFGNLKDGCVYIDNEKRGIELMTKEHAKPLYISPGHRICLKTSEEYVKRFHLEGKKLPEPLRIAHNYGLFLKKNLRHKEVIEASLEQIKQDFPETESL
jgi:deoxyribonuclease V